MTRELEIISARRASVAGVEQLHRIREMRRAQLYTVRAIAQNWRNGVGLAAVGGGAIAFLAAPDVLKEATRQSVVDGGYLLLFGAVLTVIAVVFAMRASFGWPLQLKIVDENTLQEWEAKETNRSVWLLRFSMIFSGLALVAFAYASAVLLFGVPFFWHQVDWA
ncbi:hypothetical protein [Microbacterium phyllosphaerae]|uniref:hypothetical protein n=1 Tax=Microbacterium phyllosphaerae TaxID=124798 RepID=UPI0011AEB3EB|nr:hypothetical protein [Microbacterium phyllosphaerae]